MKTIISLDSPYEDSVYDMKVEQEGNVITWTPVAVKGGDVKLESLRPIKMLGADREKIEAFRAIKISDEDMVGFEIPQPEDINLRKIMIDDIKNLLFSAVKKKEK